MNGSDSRRLLGGLGVLLVAAVAFVLGGTTGAPAEAVADTVAVETADMEAMKGMLVDGFERFKTWDVSIAHSMPENAMDWSPAEGVRSFSDQLIHTAANGFIGDVMFGEAAPAMGVAEGAGASKADIAAAIESSYDWLIMKFRAMSPADLAEEVDFFGQTMPRWRVGTFALEHSMWTRGQMVPYFRANGMAPPDVVLF